MIDFLYLAQHRYTTKKYDATRKIEEAQIEALKEILRLSPSSINSQPWLFTVVGEGKTKSILAKHSRFNQHKVEDCSHVVVFSVWRDSATFEQEASDRLSAPAWEYYLQWVKPGGEISVQAWMAHQVYLSLGFFLAACAGMGIDATPMEGIDAHEYDRVLGSENTRTLFAVAIGYRSAEDSNQPQTTPKSRRPSEEVIDVQ